MKYDLIFPNVTIEADEKDSIKNSDCNLKYKGGNINKMEVTRERVLQEYEDSLQSLTPKVNGFFKEHRFLSNFHIAPIAYRGLRFRTTEHAYMSMKVDSFDWWVKLSLIETPKEARAIGQTCKLRDDWELVKVKFMYEVNFCKYTQHEDLRKLLIKTRDMELIENNWWGDIFWGCYGPGGQNQLGKVLMKIREEIV